MNPGHTGSVASRFGAGVSPRWEDPRTVAGFVASPPNEQLLAFARERWESGATTCLGTDLASPMLAAAQRRVSGETRLNVALVRAPMTPLPFRDATFDLIVAHGIWNLARSGAAFRGAVADAARVARPGAGLFLFTFSRHTLPDDAMPDPGESFVFSSWNGEPQCFLTEAQIVDELARAGFVRDRDVPLTEYNRPTAGTIRAGGPVIYEGTFTRIAA
jgi:hypothetical protein